MGAVGSNSGLRRARIAQNLMLEETAERLNRITGGAADASLVSAWESGRRRTGAKNRQRLSRLYRERPEVLFAHQDGRDAASALEATGTDVVVKVLTRYTDLVEAMVEVVAGAREYLVVTGSRSREKTYLGAIETAVAQQPDLVHYRVLYGPPRHRGLSEHLVRLLELRDPGERRNGVQTLHIGMVEPLEAMERYFVASETAAVVPLPSFHGAYVRLRDLAGPRGRGGAGAARERGVRVRAAGGDVGGRSRTAGPARRRAGTGRSVKEDLVAHAIARSASVIELAQELIRRPSRGGIDDYAPVLGVLEEWLAGRGLPHRRLHDASGRLVGLLVEITGGRPGPWWALDACVDTAPFGDEEAWTFPPTAADIADGFLRGRGAADSKLAASVFCHIAADLLPHAGTMSGGLAVLLDVDEHTGGFGGARAYLADSDAAIPAGVMIGYPGFDDVVVGGRGLWRATLTVSAASGHSGSSRKTVGAISRAARLVQLLDTADLPGTPPAGTGFGLPPKLSVTSVHGGEGFSVTADRCDLNVDVRTTPAFDAHDAETLVRKAAAELDAELPGPAPTRITPVACWPPFRLKPHEQPAAALMDAAVCAGLEVRAKTAGPSNIGNLLAGEAGGIPATAGFGVPYEGLHGIDERAHLAELPQVYAVYERAVLRLLDMR